MTITALLLFTGSVSSNGGAWYSLLTEFILAAPVTVFRPKVLASAPEQTSSNLIWVEPDQFLNSAHHITPLFMDFGLTKSMPRDAWPPNMLMMLAPQITKLHLLLSLHFPARWLPFRQTKHKLSLLETLQRDCFSCSGNMGHSATWCFSLSYTQCGARLPGTCFLRFTLWLESDGRNFSSARSRENQRSPWSSPLPFKMTPSHSSHWWHEHCQLSKSGCLHVLGKSISIIAPLVGPDTKNGESQYPWWAK